MSARSRVADAWRRWRAFIVICLYAPSFLMGVVASGFASTLLRSQGFSFWIGCYPLMGYAAVLGFLGIEFWIRFREWRRVPTRPALRRVRTVLECWSLVNLLPHLFLTVIVWGVGSGVGSGGWID